MRSTAIRFYYGLKLTFSPYLITALALACACGFVIAQADALNIGEASYSTVRNIMLIVMPVLSVLIFANLLSEEWEHRTFKMQLSYPFSSSRFLMERVGLGILQAGLFFWLLGFMGHVGLAELTLHDWQRLIVEVAPASLFLGGLAHLCAVVGRNVLVGLGAGITYWLFEMMSMGQWTERWFLFHALFPRSGVSQETVNFILISLFIVMSIGSLLILTRYKAWIIRSS